VGRVGQVGRVGRTRSDAVDMTRGGAHAYELEQTLPDAR